MNLITLFLFFGLTFFSICWGEKDLDQKIVQALEQFHVPGAAIGLVVDDQVVMLKGYGFRNLEKRLPVSEKTLFPIASCTKAFTATLLAQLVEEGKIKWDDPVTQHIPHFQLFNEKLTAETTIRDLAAHRLGLYRHDAIWFFNQVSRSDVMNFLQYLEPVHPFREKFEYNNLLYTVLGNLIENKRGLSWEDAIRTHIFLPLGMISSNATTEELTQGIDISLPYADIEGKLTPLPYRVMHPVSPGGGINSNAADMVKWIQFQLVNPKQLSEMHTLQIDVQNKADEVFQKGYGLGWFIGSYRGLSWINHAGHNDGFFAEVSLLPEKKIGLVILTNSSTDGGFFITAIRNMIFDQLLGYESGNWLEKLLLPRQQAKERLHLVPQISDHPKDLHNYTGYYEHPAYGTARIHLKDDQFTLSYERCTILLSFKKGTAFTGKIPDLLHYGVNPNIEVTFIKNELGEISEVHIPFESFRGAKPVIFKKK